jgi:hypothetical protein
VSGHTILIKVAKALIHFAFFEKIEGANTRPFMSEHKQSSGPEQPAAPEQAEEAKEHWVWVSQARNLLENFYVDLCQHGEKTPMPTGTTMRRYTNEIREILGRIDDKIEAVAPDQAIDSRR